MNEENVVKKKVIKILGSISVLTLIFILGYSYLSINKNILTSPNPQKDQIYRGCPASCGASVWRINIKQTYEQI